MKRNRLRVLFWGTGTAVFCVLLYALSFGPALRWVVSPIVGQHPSATDAAAYDGRLDAYYRFYAPLIRAREWLFWRISFQPEHLLERYDGLFARPAKLADGRQVFTTVDAGLEPGESANDFLRQVLDGIGLSPRPGTEIYLLPRTRRLLVILAPDESDLLKIMLEAEEPTPAGFAELRID